MKIKNQYEKYKLVENSFTCPLCHSDVTFENMNSLVCDNGHCFDLSKRGYINFLPGQHQTNYSKELFEYRRKIFEAGFYKRIAAKICEVIKEYIESKLAVCETNKEENSDVSSFADETTSDSLIHILDAGSGEGYFASKIKHNGIPCEMYCMDNIKDAVVLGASAHKDIFWTVGDLTNIPLKSGTFDCIINIFAPSNYSEFSRLLKEDGILIKTVPGPLYLSELRDAAGEQLRNREYSNREVVSLFESHTEKTEIHRVSYTLPVTEEEIKCFSEMTPLLINVDKSKISFDAIRHITIECDILTGKLKIK